MSGDEFLAQLRQDVLKAAAAQHRGGPLGDAVHAVLDGRLTLREMASLTFVSDSLGTALSDAIDRRAEYDGTDGLTKLTRAYDTAVEHGDDQDGDVDGERA